MNIKLSFNSLFIFTLIISGCYTYNVPSGSTVPLMSEEGESVITLNGNFNEIGASYTYALTEHALFTASGNLILTKNDYNQTYDSLFYKKTPNNFEVGFGYFGKIHNFRNMIVFGIGSGNDVYNYPINKYDYNTYRDGYYQSEFIQYFLQYTGGFKYKKNKRFITVFKEQGMTIRYAYHDYHIIGITNEHKVESIWNEEFEYWEYISKTQSYKTELTDFFNSLTFYYFLRRGTERIQFEISPGFSFYYNQPKFENVMYVFDNIHFNVGITYRLNKQ